MRICIRPLDGAFVLLAIMDIRAHPISFVQKALTGRYYPRNFLPICALGIGIQQARVRHQMLLIIRGQSWMCGRQVLNIWINEPALWAG